MSNPDHWNTLASSLGAEVPAETPSAEEKPATPAPSPARPAPLREKKPAPPRPAADWSQLAGALGIEPVEPPGAKEPAKPPAPAKPASSRRPATTEAAIPEGLEFPPYEPALETDEFLADEFAADEDFDEEVIEAELVETELTETGDETSDADADLQRGGRKRRRRRRGGRRSRRDRPASEGEGTEAQPFEAAEPDEASKPDEAIDDWDRDPLEGIDVAEHDEETEGPPRERTGRRRRRRGRGRGREAKPASEADEPASAERDDEEEDLADEEALTTVPEDADNGESEAGQPSGKNSHRAIPSWDDAVGHIIAGNMEARSKSPKTSAPRGRGRGRGGRGSSRGNGQRRS